MYRHYPQCFTGVGWQDWAEGINSEPIICEVSNLNSERELQTEVTFQSYTLEGAPYRNRLSRPIAAELISQFEVEMEECKCRGGGPASVGSVMVRLVRRAAKRHTSEGIGRQAIFSCIPRVPAQRGARTGYWTVSNLPTRLDTLSFHDLSSQKPDDFDYAPTMVIGRKVFKCRLSRRGTINIIPEPAAQ